MNLRLDISFFYTVSFPVGKILQDSAITADKTSYCFVANPVTCCRKVNLEDSIANSESSRDLLR